MIAPGSPCPACPLEARALFAAAKNAVSRFRDGLRPDGHYAATLEDFAVLSHRMEELAAAVERYEPTFLAHVADHRVPA